MKMHRSAGAAVEWAYTTIASDILQMSSIGRWRGAERTTNESERLTAHEAHGYAAQICLHLHRLEVPEHAVVHCEIWPKRLDNRRSDPSYVAALQLLARSILGTQGTGVHSNEAARLIVMQYLSDGRKGMGIRLVREEEKCRMREALDRRTKAWQRLDIYHSRAWAKLDESLRAAGFVGD